MKKLLAISLIAASFSACVSNQTRQLAATTSLKNANCEQLVAQAKDQNFVLHNLASIYAKQKCGLPFDYGQLNDKELKIFSAGFDLDKTYNRSFRIPRPNVFANTPAWTQAWALYKSNSPQAATALNDIVKTTENMSDKSRALFFLGKLAQKKNRAAEAKQYFELAATNDFYSYHALAAHYELGRPLPAINNLLKSPVKTFAFNPTLSFLSPEDLRLFNALAENEEFSMIDRSCFAFGKSWSECENMGIYLAEKYKYFHMVHFSFSYISDAEKRDVFIRYSQFLYPVLYTDIVKEMSRETGTAESLIYGIIKQESSYRPFIVNTVPAYGLMQLTPDSAQDAADTFKFKGFSKNNPDTLFNPQMNIRMGTYELTKRIRQYKGQLTYVGIAYNAGPKRVQDWPKLYSTQDMFEFIEDVPYWETRNYVKMGARNMLFYQRLAEPDKEFYFPKEFIEASR